MLQMLCNYAPPPPPGSIPGYLQYGGRGRESPANPPPPLAISIPSHYTHNTAARIPTQLQGYLHTHSTHIYRAPQCMSPRQNWDSPSPSPASECALPPVPKGGGGHTRPRLRGWASPNSDDWRKSFALCLLCAYIPTHNNTQ
jgi:hypothetical protein